MLDLGQISFIHNYALRDMRRSYKKLWVITTTLFISLLLLSLTFAIKQSMVDEISANSKELLGGDILIDSGVDPLDEVVIDKLSSLGTVSSTVNFFTMLSGQPGSSVFVDMRAADSQYPLYGELKTVPPSAIDSVLNRSDNPGILINENIKSQLSLQVGQEVTVMNTKFIVAGVISSVPDLARSAVFGEFAIISKKEFDGFDLRSENSFLHHEYRLKISKEQFEQKNQEAISMFTDDDKVRVKLPKDSTESLRRIIDNFSNFLNLVSVSAMIIAGIGISNTMLSFINQRSVSVAIKKSLGFSSRVIKFIYFYEILLILFVTSVLAYCIGVMSPLIANFMIPEMLGITLQPSFSLINYLNIAFIGLLIVLIFSIPSLYSINSIRAMSLFRNTFLPVNLHFSTRNIVYLVLLTAILVAYFVFQTRHQTITLSYFMAFFASLVIFYLVASVLIATLKRFKGFNSNSYKIAYRNIVSKKSLAPIITISLGVGLTLLLTLSLVANNLKREIAENIPAKAPDLFFVSINKAEKGDLEEFIRGIDSEAILDFNPMISASFVALNSVPIESLVSEGNPSRWAIRGDRRISWLKQPKDNSPMVEGDWWESGDTDNLHISFDSSVASDIGISIGDKITLNILGREVEGTVRNFRKVEYRSLGTNFAIIINEAYASKLPYEYIGTLKSSLDTNKIQSQIINKFPNVSAIKIDRIISKVSEIINKIFFAVSAISAVVIVIGLIVVVSAILVQANLRKYNNLIYKILGVGFATIVKAMTIEFMLIYLSLIAFSISVAAIASHYVVENIFQFDWVFDINLSLMVVASTGIVTFLLILFANKNMFSPAVYPLIRNE
ncbi:MAG: FtsX-like permease family protein [PS1 clade bacterium]